MEMHPVHTGQHLCRRSQRLQPSSGCSNTIMRASDNEKKTGSTNGNGHISSLPYIALVSSADQNKRASGASTPKAPSITDVRESASLDDRAPFAEDPQDILGVMVH